MSSKSRIIVIAEKEFELVKTGREQAEQVIQLGKWLNEYGLPALQGISNEEGEVQFTGGFAIFGELLNSLSADALIDLYTLALGCTKQFANKHFDISELIDILEAVYESQPSIGRVISRFFSPGISIENSEEPSTA